MTNNLLILAAGEGKRCSQFTYNNALPKVLMSVGQHTILEAILDSYKDVQLSTIYIACLKKHEDAIKDIISYKNLGELNVFTISFEAQPTPLDSLKKAFDIIGYSSTANHNWYINWSDCFADKIPTVTDNTIFADPQCRHRNLAYECNGSVVVSTSNQSGNVPGIFYVKAETLDNFLRNGTVQTGDFDRDCMAGKSVIVDLNSVTDIGDIQKYTDFMSKPKSTAICRYFNSISFGTKFVTKKPITPKGVKLHKIEYEFYKQFGNYDTGLCKLLSYNPETMEMTLERLYGKTCQSVVDQLKTTKDKLTRVHKLIDMFKNACERWTAIPCILPDNEQLKQAVLNELYFGLDMRVKPCLGLIETVESYGIRYIDGKPISSYEKVKRAIDIWIHEKFAENWFKFGIVHGDPNTDNTMLCKNKDGHEQIRFVDPRGYFGGLKELGVGLVQYDLAKFVYGFTGYSKFNHADFIVTDVNGMNLQTKFNKEMTPGIADVDIELIDVPKDIKVLIGIIWMRLTSYIINDPMKSVAAYFYGNSILTQYLNIR